jgi:two-component system chemotaxis response regulator CheY
MRRVLGNALRGVGCDEVVEAADGKQALERCGRDTDAVVTAWNMPVMGGLELTRHLRASPETTGVRILMVTARNLKQDVLEAVQAGVNGYLLKPFTLEALKLKLEELLQPAAGDQAKAA